jgi:hypothetical protein
LRSGGQLPGHGGDRLAADLVGQMASGQRPHDLPGASDRRRRGLAARGCRWSRPVPDWRGGTHQGRPVNQEMRGGGAIRTPDQRLRVFVSSTVGEAGELAAERQAVVRAISALRLTRCCSSWGRDRTRRGSCTGPTWPKATSSSGCTGSATGGSTPAWSSPVWRRNSGNRRDAAAAVSSLKERGRSIPTK